MNSVEFDYLFLSDYRLLGHIETFERGLLMKTVIEYFGVELWVTRAFHC